MQIPFGRAARQHEAAVAVTAIDITLLVDLQVNPRMAQGGSGIGGTAVARAANLASAIARDARAIDDRDFGHVFHADAVIASGLAPQYRRALNRKTRGPFTRSLPAP